MGVRYIDLRSILKQSDDTLYLEHGFYAGKLMDELKGVAEFVHGYPGEVVILDMNHIKKFVLKFHSKVEPTQFLINRR